MLVCLFVCLFGACTSTGELQALFGISATCRTMGKFQEAYEYACQHQAVAEKVGFLQDSKGFEFSCCSLYLAQLLWYFSVAAATAIICTYWYLFCASSSSCSSSSCIPSWGTKMLPGWLTALEKQILTDMKAGQVHSGLRLHVCGNSLLAKQTSWRRCHFFCFLLCVGPCTVDGKIVC